MNIHLFGTGYLHDPQYFADLIPRAGEQIRIGDDRFHVLQVCWYVENEALVRIHVYVAPDPENQERS